MAQTESTVKLIFEGVEKGVGVAAAKAGAAVKSLSSDTDKLSGIGDKAGAGLAMVGKGLLAISATGSAAGVLAGVAAAATEMSGALLLAPAAFSVAKIGLGALNMAAGDFMTAISNMDDDKKFNKAMKSMGDSAKEFAGEIKYVHDRVAEGLSEALFKGLGDKFEEMTQKTIPTLQGAMMGIVLSARLAAINLMDMLASAERQKDINKLITDSSQIWDQLLSSITPLAAAFIDISVVGSQALVELTAGASGAAQKFADFIANARETGQLKGWIDTGIQAFKDLWHIVENTGSIIKTIFTGMGTDMGSPLAKIAELTAQFAAFLKTVEAQEGLKVLGETLRVVGEAVGGVVLTAIQELAKTFVAWGPTIQVVATTLGEMLVGALQVVGPLLQGIGVVLAEFPGVVSAATVAVGLFVVAMKGLSLLNTAKDLLGVSKAIDAVATSADGATAKAGAAGQKGGISWGKGFIGGLGLAGVGVAGAIFLDSVIPKDQGRSYGAGFARDMLAEMAGVFSGEDGNIFKAWEISRWISNPLAMATDAAMRAFKDIAGIASSPITINFSSNTAPAMSDVTNFINTANSKSGTVNMNGRTENAGQALAELLQRVNNGNGTVTMNGQHMPASEALKNVIEQINKGVGTVTLNGQAVPAGQALLETLQRINSSTGTLKVAADGTLANNTIQGMINNWNGRQINLIVTATGSGGVASAGRLATGGPISGPGTGTSDTAGMYALSDGEYVATAKQVQNAGGPDAFGRMMGALDRGPVQGLAHGGRAWGRGHGRGGDRRHYRHAMRGRDDWGWRRHRRRRRDREEQGPTLHFSGNTDTAMATALQGMIRTGKIQLR